METYLDLQRALRTGEGPERVQQLIERLDLIRHKVQPAALRRYQYGRQGSGETPLEVTFADLYVEKIPAPVAQEVRDPVMLFKIELNPLLFRVSGITPVKFQIEYPLSPYGMDYEGYFYREADLDPDKGIPTMEKYLRERFLGKRMQGLEVQSVTVLYNENVFNLAGVENFRSLEVETLIPWTFTLTQEDVGL